MIRAFIASLALSTLCIPEVQASEFTENHLLGHFAMNGGRVYIDSALCDRPVFGVQHPNFGGQLFLIQPHLLYVRT